MLLWTKVFPVILVGMVVWIIGILVIGPALLVSNIVLFFVCIIAYIIMWIATLVIASSGKNTLAFFMFLGTSALSGVLTTPLFVWGAMTVGLETGFQIGIVSVTGSLTGVAVMGVAGYRNRHNHELAASLGSFLFWGFLATIIFEMISMFIFGPVFDIIMFITSIIMIWMTLIYAFYNGMRLKDMLDNGLWMYASAMFFMNIIVLATRLFYVLVRIVAALSDN